MLQDEEIVESETYNSHEDTVIENQEIHEVKHQQHQQLLPPSMSQQQYTITQSDYSNGPTSVMEVNTSELQSDWQPLSLPTNIQDTYDSNVQYMRNMDESSQYQQPQQQQNYWSQQSFYQGNYGRNEPIPSNWQQQSGLTSDQAEIDNSQQQDKWNYEVKHFFL